MRTRRLLFGAAGALLIALLWIGAVAANAPRDAPADRAAFTVTYVFDGDTIEAEPADAAARALAGTEDPVRIRLIGIDTPEGTPEPECGADAARERLVELLPEGSRVSAASDREPRDRYDRLLLYLWDADGAFVNATLVAEGHAEALRVEPNVAHAGEFDRLEAEARAAGVGQWGAC
ncbi:thermonuclease family protein [Microbacterium dauci]|uniref:Thermonuclease family protein n=1 Tax=Microbacterium dauci TaxID=3048008 RepID=A0ABT6ZH75_9MICO|nr:thermonuclease family protein [Microbacterium sp. LX3-4]MDJ1115489.1 thermonuclease family protein [Microbacterium sp. LX3-4]